jgi:phage terminase large subunit GpA-like protein
MELFDRRRYYHCNHCGTFHFIESPDVDGVRVLRPHEAALPCPLCQATLMQALLDDRSVVEHCAVPVRPALRRHLSRSTRANSNAGSTARRVEPAWMSIRTMAPATS